MDLSSLSGVGPVGQAGVNLFFCGTPPAALPQHGMGSVPQASGMAHTGPPWGGAPSNWQGGSLAGFPLISLPPCDVITSLGDHLSLALRDKILWGEYVDVFSLLYREVERNDKNLMDDRKKEVLKRRPVDRTWSNWLTGFLIYMGVTANANTLRAAALIQYLDIIFKAYSYYAGPYWLQYDDEFCMMVTIHSEWRWDLVQHSIWVQIS